MSKHFHHFKTVNYESTMAIEAIYIHKHSSKHGHLLFMDDNQKGRVGKLSRNLIILEFDIG